MGKKVVVSGATGQDGSYMVEYLLAHTTNTVILAARRTSQAILSNLTGVLDNPRVKLVTMDLTDPHSIEAVIKEEKPDYFINLGAQTFVADSWKAPALHMQVNAISLIHILEAVRRHVPTCRVYSAGSSEQYGDVKYSPQDIAHPNSPRSVYGVSKVAAQAICKVYRESYGLYVVHGILFNHESERRQDYFVTRKITKGVARIARAIKDGKPFEPIELGNLDAKRDWSHAEDFVDGIWRMLNQETHRADWPRLVPFYDEAKSKEENWAIMDSTRDVQGGVGLGYLREYILSSGETHTVREFVKMAFAAAGIRGIWGCRGSNSVGTGKASTPQDEAYVIGSNTSHTGRFLDAVVVINPAFYRPCEVNELWGNSTPARTELGWTSKVSFTELVTRMVKADMAALDL